MAHLRPALRSALPAVLVALTMAVACSGSDQVTQPALDDLQIAAPASPQLERSGKVDICHVPKGNPANAHLISISANAEQTHRTRHGDAKPWEIVPGSDPQMVFDDDCGQVPYEPPEAQCPCYSYADVERIVEANPDGCYWDDGMASVVASGTSASAVDMSGYPGAPGSYMCSSVKGMEWFDDREVFGVCYDHIRLACSSP